MHERLRAVYGRLRVAYGQLRRVPGVGPAVWRLVWAAKGAVGRPVRWPQSAGAAPAPGDIPIGDGPTDAAETRLRTELSLAMAAIEGLAARLAPAPTPRRPRSHRRPRSPRRVPDRPRRAGPAHALRTLRRSMSRWW